MKSLETEEVLLTWAYHIKKSIFGHQLETLTKIIKLLLLLIIVCPSPEYQRFAVYGWAHSIVFLFYLTRSFSPRCSEMSVFEISMVFSIPERQYLTGELIGSFEPEGQVTEE